MKTTLIIPTAILLAFGAFLILHQTVSGPSTSANDSSSSSLESRTSESSEQGTVQATAPTPLVPSAREPHEQKPAIISQAPSAVYTPQQRPTLAPLPAKKLSDPLQSSRSQPAPPAAVAQTEQEIPVPTGAQLPAAIVDEGTAFAPAQAMAADAIAGAFMDAVSQGGAGNGSPSRAQGSATANPGQHSSASPQSVWDQARAQADARYRALFGDSAYNAYTKSARIEAMAEQK